MTFLLPAGLADTDDVAVEHLTERAVVHRPGVGVTGCGRLPMWLMQHPLPAAGLLSALSPRWCDKEGCFPRRSAWKPLVNAAHPDRPNVARFDVKDRADLPVLNAGQHRRHGRIYALLHRGRTA